jgi:mannosyl-oligosaccharide alpha-1,2-mannosidase
MILLLGIFIYLVRLAFQFKPFQVEFNYDPGPVRPELYPVSETLTLPRGWPAKIPKIQSEPVVETPQMMHVREERLQELRATCQVAWRGYREEAWGKDESRPVSGGFKTPFCGWGATLVDSLDTLWIMELYDEFIQAVQEVQKIDFTGTEGCQINLFETTIRHLGGLLSAFDLSGGEYYILIEKAVELAEVLFTAFDTPNRMPTPFYVWSSTNPDANSHEPSQSSVLAMLGTLSLEFTRLSQITGNDKYFDGIQRVMNELEKWQSQTPLPGMWPAIVDSAIFNQSIALGSPSGGSEELFTLGALADSAYEYLPKVCNLYGSLSVLFADFCSNI